jgi:tight adherence protein C
MPSWLTGGLPARLLEPQVLLWPLLLSVAVGLFVSAQPLGRPRPDLGWRLRRLDGDPATWRPRPARGVGADPFANQPIARLLRPLAAAAASRVLRATNRVLPGFGPDLAEDLRVAWPEYDVLSFWTYKIGLALLALVVLGLGNLWHVEAGPGLLWAVLLAAGGFLYPDRVLARRLAAHHERITAELGALLVLAQLALEAGLGAEAALVEAGRYGRGPVARGLHQAGTRRGVPGQGMPGALDDLARQLGSPAVRRLARLVRVTHRQGSPLEEALHVEVQALREARRLALVRWEHRVPVLLVAPLAVLVLLTLVLVALPALARFEALGGG